MKITHNIIIGLGLALTTSLFAQQDVLYTQYFNNFSLINPAYSGNNGTFTLLAGTRNQWANNPGGPSTQSLALHSPVGKKVGLGLSIVHDEVFVLEESHFYVDFSYTVELSEKSSLAFGLKAGGSYLKVDLLSLGIENDPLFTENISLLSPNIGAGAYYFTNKFYASFSVLNILQTRHYKKSGNVVSSASDRMVFYGSAGYVISLDNQLSLKPSLLVKYTQHVPLATDVSLNLLWKNAFELGVSYRFDDSISSVLQLSLSRQLKAGFSYTSYLLSSDHDINSAFEVGLVFFGNNSNAKRKAPFHWRKH